MIKAKAEKLRKRYGQLSYPVDIEYVAKREGLTITDWPLLPPVDEMKVGSTVGLRKGLSCEWRRWDIAHALGHKVLQHRGNQLLAPCSRQEEAGEGGRRVCGLFPYARGRTEETGRQKLEGDSRILWST
jgi:hypothetical protein